MPFLPEYVRRQARWFLCVMSKTDDQNTSAEEWYSPISLMRISEVRSSEPSSHEQAMSAWCNNLPFADGAGICAEGTLVVIRLTKCFDHVGSWLPWAYPVWQHFQTYWELYPNWRSAQCICSLDSVPSIKGSFALGDGTMEIMSGGQLCALSGDPIPTSTDDVQNCQGGMDWLLTKVSTPGASVPPEPDGPLASLNVRPIPSDGGASQPTEWLEPRSLDSILPPVRQFDPHSFLPRTFVEYVLFVANGLQIAIDLIAIPLLIAFAAAVGRRAVIRPKRRDPWKVIPNVWGVIIDESGFMKSPALAAGMKFLEILQWESFEACRPENAGIGALRTCVRYCVNDVTIPKLIEILRENPAGLLFKRDEISGLLEFLNKRGQEGDRQFVLEAWSGDVSYTSDRIGRGTTFVPNLCLSIVGSTQPQKWQQFLSREFSYGGTGDGFPQRFQLAVYPDRSDDYQWVDKEDSEAEQQVMTVFRRLVGMPADPPSEYRFDNEAQEAFKTWLEGLEVRLRREEMHAVLRTHLSKFRSLVPSMALLLHLAEEEHPGNLIPAPRVLRAILFGEYLESHARRIYACVVGGPGPSVKVLSERIRAGTLGTRFTINELASKDWSGLNTSHAARAAVRILEDAGWVRRVPHRTSSRGGRPSEIYEVNPRVFPGS